MAGCSPTKYLHRAPTATMLCVQRMPPWVGDSIMTEQPSTAERPGQHGPSTDPYLAPLPAPSNEGQRRAALRVMKRRASLLLGLVTAIFAALTIAGPSSGWVPYAKATAEAAMVGGIADWFAITALFRHPFRLPIPHTAIISERKDDFGRTLATFVQENFLNADVVIRRLRAARSIERAAGWFAKPDN